MYIFYYFRHFLIARSRHGTHSPFVYRLAKEVIYKKKDGIWNLPSSYQALIHKVADYYESNIVFNTKETGLYLAYQCSIAETAREELAFLQYQYRFIIMTHLYSTKENYRKWRDIQSDQRFVVCVDLFHFGIIFFRKKQPKQTFRLRYPFWKY